MAEESKQRELAPAEYLERALEDLNRARQQAGEEIRSAIDSAVGRVREALDDVQTGAGERAEKLRTRAEDRVSEWQHMLEDASEDARRELGIRTVRAQRSEDALEAIAEEVKHQRKELAGSR
jgi:uncharacterized protein YicC (UPF0701 family)